MSKVCLRCGKEFIPNRGYQLYCGSRRKRTGCAYIYELERHKEYYHKNKRRILKVVKKYYVNNRFEANSRVKIYYQKNKIKIKKRGKQYYVEKRQRILEEKKKYHLLKKYNLTISQFNKLSVQQNGVCAICERENIKGKRLYVDHCHKTGKIRGLLCSECNKGLGSFKDSIKLFKKAIKYLREEK